MKKKLRLRGWVKKTILVGGLVFFLGGVFVNSSFVKE